MKRLLFIGLGLLLMQNISAQNPKEEIRGNVLLSASNYTAYIAPTEMLTPAPKGYEPFYMSHYGRHGSRWLTSDKQYTGVLDELKNADKFGKLTSKGQQLLEQLTAFHKTTENRAGELTSVGERQWHGIGARMTEHFPEIFSGDAQVDARATVVIRCILSMEAACEELAAFNSGIRIHNDVSQSFQYYLNASWPSRIRSITQKGDSIQKAYQIQVLNPSRHCKALFKDEAYVYSNIKAKSFMQELFDVVSNMQSHDDGLNLYDLFTFDEIYELWRTSNIGWYTQYGPAKQTQGLAPYSQEPLLRNIITTADTIVNNASYHGATLRWGHEVCLMPLACLLELGDCGKQVDDLNHLEDYWVNYRIFPMASNIQLVFYRPKKGKSGDILVKALLNEREVSLPVATDSYPYYKWNDLRDYYLKKLDAFDNRK